MRFRTRSQEVEAIADALVGMVQQHTEALDDGSYGHSFMRADEDAFETLVEYGYATYVNPDNPYAIRFVDAPIPDLIRTVADYEELPDGTILETENTKTILVSYGGDVFRALDYVTTAQELVERKVVCSVVRLGGDG